MTERRTALGRAAKEKKMDLIDKYLNEGKKILKFSTKSNYLDEMDALLVRGGVTGTPDFSDITITIDKKDLKKAEKILKGTSYRRYTVSDK